MKVGNSITQNEEVGSILGGCHSTVVCK